MQAALLLGIAHLPARRTWSAIDRHDPGSKGHHVWALCWAEPRRK